jgi:adenylate cyclase
MLVSVNGELAPVGGGDAIPLLRTPLTLGRRSSCDVHLDFPNISGVHCELSFRDGYWTIRDTQSTNGIKVNGVKVTQRPMKPGDELSIGKRKYRLNYTTSPEAQQRLDEMLSEQEEVWGTSLLEKAGITNPRSGDVRHSRRTSLDED